MVSCAALFSHMQKAGFLMTWFNIIYPVRLAFISCHRTLGYMPGDWATGSKSSILSKCGISGLKVSRSSYLDNHLNQKAFILGLKSRQTNDILGKPRTNCNTNVSCIFVKVYYSLVTCKK